MMKCALSSSNLQRSYGEWISLLVPGLVDIYLLELAALCLLLVHIYLLYPYATVAHCLIVLVWRLETNVSLVLQITGSNY